MSPSTQRPAYGWDDRWAQKHTGVGSDHWLLFRRDVELTDRDNGTIHLFVESRYRLWVNGQAIGHGPARFAPGARQYDSYDLAGLLSSGTNAIVVEVRWVNVRNYQTLPNPVAGLAVWGSAGGVDLSTPGDWHVRELDAHIVPAAVFSFAQPPAEALDARKIDPAWFTTAAPDSEWRPIAACEGSGEPLSPRSIPMPGATMLPLKSTITSGYVQPAELRTGCVIADNAASVRPGKGREKPRFAYATYIHAPTARSAELGVFWGPNYLNGQLLAEDSDKTLGNRQTIEVRLNEGWNLLYGEPEVLQVHWPIQVAIPAGLGLSFHACPDLLCRDAIKHTAAMAASELGHSPSNQAELDALGLEFRRIAEDAAAAMPAREMAWDRLTTDGPRVDSPHAPFTFEFDARHQGWSATFDFEGEYLGRATIEIDAPSGTVVDLAYGESLRGDGAIDLFSSSCFAETADRYVCRAGRQTFESFDPRGGRYLQLTVRKSREAAGPITIHQIGLRDARCLSPVIHRRQFGDELLDWLWDRGIETLNACTEDAFVDCPWRERGLYLGDGLVQSLLHYRLTEDVRMGRRCLELFAGSVRDDGLLPGCACSWLRQALPDFALIYAIWLRDWVELTGDLETAGSVWPIVEGVLASPAWITSVSDLWDGDGMGLFIDWGATADTRTGQENATLNALRVAALRSAAELAGHLGFVGRAEHYTFEADRIAALYRERLWMPQAGRFAVHTRDGYPNDADAPHANVVALAFGLGNEAQEPDLTEYVIDTLLGNARRALNAAEGTGFLELYFLTFAFRALDRIGRHDVAVQILRDHYQPILDASSPTIWERLRMGIGGAGSRCHAWSLAGMIYLFDRGAWRHVAATPGGDSLRTPQSQ